MGGDNIASRIRLSPAEQAVLEEQGMGLKLGVEALLKAAQDADGKALMDAYGHLTAHMGYIQALLQARASFAYAQLLEERECHGD